MTVTVCPLCNWVSPVVDEPLRADRMTPAEVAITSHLMETHYRSEFREQSWVGMKIRHIKVEPTVRRVYE